MPRSLSPPAKLTAIFLFTHALDDGTGIYCSVETLMEMTGLSRSAQFRAIKELIDGEYLVDDGWKVYRNGAKTRRRRLDLDRMARLRSEEDGTPQSPTDGTVQSAGTVPPVQGQSPTHGTGRVPPVGHKPSLEPSLQPAPGAREEVAEDDGSRLFADTPPTGAVLAMARPAPPPSRLPVRDTPQQPAPPGWRLPFNPYPQWINYAPIPPEPTGDPQRWMPRLSDTEHRWAVLAPGEEIDPKSMTGARRQCRGGWILRDIAAQVAEALGWHDLRRYTDWRPLCAWLDEGLDPHETILPTIRRVVARRGNVEISTLAYFDKAVRDSVVHRRAG